MDWPTAITNIVFAASFVATIRIVTDFISDFWSELEGDDE